MTSVYSLTISRENKILLRWLLAGNQKDNQDPFLDFFASPDHIDPKLQSFFEGVCFQLCEWLANAGKGSPLPKTYLAPKAFPEVKGLSADSLLSDLKLVMDGSYQPSHPGAIAHLDPPPLTASIAADFICAGLNNNLLAEELSPSLTKLEREICKWFAMKLGMSSNAGGVLASGGSLSNLMALVLARDFSEVKNISSAVILASEDSHVSLLKAIKIMGMPEDSLLKVITDAKGKLSLEDLQKKLKKIRSESKNCIAVVATAGTTVRGAIDPLEEISDFCVKEKIWMHVDAAIGGVFSLVKSTKSFLRGISNADSVTLNPQKLLGITKTSSLLIVARRQCLESTFSTGLPYIEPSEEGANGGEIGIQGTRSAEVLKLWLGLRQLGEEGIENLLQEAVNRRKYLQENLDVSKLNVISGPLHLLACTPLDFDINKTANWSDVTRLKLLNKNIMVSRPFHDGRYYLKAVMGNPHTTKSYIDILVSCLNSSVD